MRSRVIVGLSGLLVLLATGWTASSAAATPPLALDPGFVTDAVGVLSDAELADADATLGELAESSDRTLFVVLVDDFTDPSDRVEWADQVAIGNDLGPDQYLLAIATEGRAFYISADDTGPVGDSRLDEIEQQIQPYLSREDWAGAIDAAAAEFAAEPGAGAATGLIVVLAVAAGIALVVWLVVRSRRRKTAAQAAGPVTDDPFAAVGDDELESRAGSALVQVDDAISSSRQELGFATAQFGEESTAEFGDVVTAAQAKVAEAFGLKQQLDDEVPDSAEQRRAWHIRIVQLCEEADDLLEQNAEAFRQLRALEADAPQALQQLRTRRDAAEQAVAAAAPGLAELARTYDATALATVADNPAQARDRLALADSEIAEATELLVADKGGEAAYAIRTAEAAVEQAERLASAVAKAGKDLASAEDQARTQIADLEADLAAAAQLPDTAGRTASVAAATRTRVEEARSALATAPRNPQRILDVLSTANAEIDAVIGQARDAAQLAQRNQQVLQQRMLQAQAQISAADDYITTRRGAVGATARTRLAEANAAYTEAYGARDTDTSFAIERATRAAALAGQAISAAEQEVSAFSGGLGGGLGPGLGFGSGGGGLGGDILGGIIGGLIAGGASSRRPSRGGWGSGGGWSGGGGFRSSGFGGSRGRSGGGSRGRSGGGRF